MRVGLFALTCLAALTGCATGPSLQSQMAAYIGDDEQTLVQHLGVPDKQITVNGTSYLAYDRHSAEIQPNYYGSGFYGPFYDGWRYDAGYPSQIYVFFCETTFYVQNGRVVSFTLRGNDCN